MSEFDEQVLSSIDPEETADPEAPTPEPEPTPEPDPIWKTAGFESEEQFVKKVSNLSKWEKELNAQSSTLGAQKKQMQSQPEPEPVSEDGDIWDDLDPVVAKKLQRAIDKRAKEVIACTVGPQAEVAAELFNDSAEETMNTFAKDNGLDADELYSFMQTNDLLPAKPSLSLLKKQMSLAANALKGQNLDSIIESKVAEQLASMKKDGAYVKAGEPAPTKEPSEKEKSEVDPTNFTSMLKKVGLGKL